MDEVEAEVERGGLSGGGQYLPVVGIEHVGPDVDAGLEPGEFCRMHPVRGRLMSVKQPCGGEYERPRAQRDDPHARVVRRVERGRQGRVRRSV